MTIQEFSDRNWKQISTVKKWIKKGWIPGASIEKNYVPDSARVPYTAARAKKPKAVYASMVKACLAQQHIMPELYHISQEEFDGYVCELVNKGLLRKRITDGIIYYDATLLAENTQLSTIERIINGITKAVVEGGVTAMLKNS